MNGFIVTDFNQKERKKEKPFCRSKSETIFPLNRWHRRATLKNWVAIKIAFVPMPTNNSKINNSRSEERGEKKTKHIYMRINNILRSDSYFYSNAEFSSIWYLLLFSRHCLVYFYFRFYSIPNQLAYRMKCVYDAVAVAAAVIFILFFISLREKNLLRAP